MGAPLGNQFWKLRSKHGRDLIFSSPTILWEACCEYFDETSKRKWVKKDWVGKDAIEVNRETDAPFHQKTLCLFLGISEETWSQYSKREDFAETCTRVNDIIFMQKFEGASVGAYHPGLIGKSLGLVEKIQQENTGEVTVIRGMRIEK